MKEIIKNRIEYISRHIGAFTWLATLFVGCFAGLLKYMRYVYEVGKLQYLGIDSSVITVFDDNSIYSVLLSIILCVIILSFTLIPLPVMVSKQKLYMKVIKVSLMYCAFALILFWLSDGFDRIGDYKYVIMFIFSSLLLFIVLFSPSFIICFYFYSFRKDNHKNNINDRRSKTIVLALLISACIILASVFVCWAGYDIANSQSRYRIIDHKYAIIYETADSYYIADFSQINDKTNIKDIQHTVINKDNISYKWMSKEEYTLLDSTA